MTAAAAMLGDTEATPVDITLTPAQGRFVLSNAQFPAFVAGFGSGKTYALTARILRLLLEDGGPIAFYMPTFDLIRLIGIPRMEELLMRCGIEYEIKMTIPAIDTPAGRVLFRSLDKPERIVGYESTHAVVDELDTLTKEKAAHAWRMMLSRNRAQTASGINSIGVGTTPEGFRFVYEKWKKEPMAGAELIRGSTYDNAANLPAGYIEAIREQYPARLVDAYLHGEFVNLDDGLFDAETIQEETAPTTLTDFCIGVDLAISQKESADRSAIVVSAFDRTSDARYIVEAQAGRWRWTETLERIEDTYNRFVQRGVIGVVIESVQFQAMLADKATARGLPVVPVHPTKDKYTRAVPIAAAFERGSIKLLRGAAGIKDLKDEMLAFPKGAHDDLVDALVYSCTLSRGATIATPMRGRRQ